MEIVDLEIASLRAPSQVLRPLDYPLVAELARSIESTGLLQPIVVRGCEFGFEVVFGNHRLEACRRLGMKKIRASIARFTDEEAFLARVSENLLRNASINPIVEAEGYKQLLNSGWTINMIGRKIGKSDSYVCERLALIDGLDRNIRDKMIYGSDCLTPTHLELLSKVKDRAEQKRLARLVEKRKLGVRALENIINGLPLPQTIIPDEQLGECTVRIPHEFADAAGITAGQPLRIELRGKKLILEDAKTHKRKRSNRPSPLTQRLEAPVLNAIQNLRA